MNKDEAIAQIKTLTSLTADDIIGLQNCTEPQLEAILRAYKDSGTVTDRTVWTQVAAILKQVPDWAQTALTIVGVLAKIF